MSASRFPNSIESRSSWVAAAITTAILAISYGAPLLVVVGLKPITASLGTERSVVALAGALVWVGTGMGGIVMGWVADRIGVRPTVVFGALMTALGLAVSTTGQVWALSRARCSDWPLGQQRPPAAAGGLHKPLVRPTPRYRGRPDLVRAIRRRFAVADRF